MPYETILTDLTDGVFTITLNRPRANALNDQMAAEMLEALKTAERDPAVRCLVLTGCGNVFCAGQDVAAISGRPQTFSFREHLEHTYHPIVRRLRRLEKPVIGGINGAAAGAGLGIALACDLRLAAESAKFVMAFAGIGLAPDSGTSFFLPQLVGLARALEMAYTNEPMSAAEALQRGLVNRVVPDAELAGAIRELAVRLAAGPTKAFGLTKRAMNRALTLSLDEALDYEGQLQDIAGRSYDHVEGVAAFLEKRPPVFRGE
ncbi:MAG: enoyl-CoA hydratase/isomerase family protein [Chloroflexi bacterium]|nr:enoyl-CoA hydratase/isomerase family protein [Chloroflexota bacterium]